MNRKFDELSSTSLAQTSTSPHSSYFNLIQKPIEIYVFIDPLCQECWEIEPYLKKLQLEYGHFFTLRPIISNQHHTGSKASKKKKNIYLPRTLWVDRPLQSSWAVYLAIKAAELQGKRTGKAFLRKIQESLFIKENEVSHVEILMECAQSIDLDMDEFRRDLRSTTAKKALQCDLRLSKEMDVDHLPTIVFFNQSASDDGIKVSGVYPYDVYVNILSDMLNQGDSPLCKPPLEEFLIHYKLVTSREIAIIYDWSLAKVEKEMKKLQLKQVVKEIESKNGSLWKYIKET